MTSPAFKLSPSQAKIFSTRPADRGATWTSSTSMVPETALLGRRHPAEKRRAPQRPVYKTLEAQETRIGESKLARHYALETLRKEMAGYSKTPLAQKLGIKPGMKVAALNPPAGYRKLLAPLPAGVSFLEKATAARNWFIFS